MYNVPLMALIRDYVAAHPGIDTNRIYVGGCSNGGYMARKLMLQQPDYFAAGFISSLAYQSQYISDEQIKRIRRSPIWFVHSADDQTTLPNQTVLPVYERLRAAGARNVHLSYYDHVVDITGFFGGEDYRYNGHWSWVYLQRTSAGWTVTEAPSGSTAGPSASWSGFRRRRGHAREAGNPGCGSLRRLDLSAQAARPRACAAFIASRWSGVGKLSTR